MENARSGAEGQHGARPEDGSAPVLLTRELNSALTVLKGRTQLLRRRLRQAGDTARLETDLGAIERELARLTTIIEQITRGDAGS
jgi:signal transduction histidine kinase